MKTLEEKVARRARFEREDKIDRLKAIARNIALGTTIIVASAYSILEYGIKPSIERSVNKAISPCMDAVFDPLIINFAQGARIANDPLMAPKILDDYKTLTETQKPISTNQDYSQ